MFWFVDYALVDYIDCLLRLLYGVIVLYGWCWLVTGGLVGVC